MSKSTHHLNDTIVALATPPGKGALGVIRVSGENAFRVVNDIFIGADLVNCESHTIHFGRIENEKGQSLDEVLTFLFKAPASYTGEDVIEISCHGSSYIIQEIMDLIIRKGARMADPGEFTLRAFLHGKMDLSQAEAVADLIASSSEASHHIAMTQMRGGISNDLKDLRDRLIHFASMLELELDFSEEDVEFANRNELKALIKQIVEVINALIQSFRLGNAIRTGVNTVIAGRPNAGKSTLLNAMLKEERAIVSEIAGTTRDTIEEILNIRGIEFRLIDTAGIREAQDQIEAIGVERTMEKIRKATLLIYVFDVTECTTDMVRQDLEALHAGPDTLVVANKMDLDPYLKVETFASEAIRPNQIIPLSAANKMNIEFLKDKLFTSIAHGDIQLENPVVSNTRHLGALEKALETLQNAHSGLEQQTTSDFIAMDIRQTIHYLGEITGEITTDDLLENIFRNFCIGK
jgi:tRNA modification GTPase